MSGIEVAGIVLAVLGTLIQGVGGYNEVITGRDVNLLVESLKDNKIMFSNSIEYLLRSVSPTEELTRLLNDPTGNQWRDADLDHRVIAHLGQDAEIILQKIGDIYATLDRLQRKLPTQKDDATVVSRATHIIKCFVRGPYYSASLERLRSRISEFRTLVEDALRLAPTRGVTSNTLRDLSLVQECASWLHEDLKASWKCSCERSHPANIRLDIWSPWTAVDHKNDTVCLRFSLLFADDAQQVQHDHWLTAEMTTSRSGSNTVRPRAVNRLSSTHVSSANATPVTSITPSLAHPNPTSGLPLTISTTALTSQGNAQPGGFSLCPFPIVSPRRIRTRVGSISEKKGHHNCDLYSLPDAAATRSFTTLAEVYNKQSTLSNKNRVQLALMLAWGVLQISSTSWLEGKWTKENILLVMDTPNRPLPYLSHRFESSHRDSTQSTLSPTTIDQVSDWVKNTSLFALGIFLLEMCYDRPIEELANVKEKNENGEASDHTPFLTAMRLSKLAQDELGVCYAQAIKACLECPNIDLDTDGRPVNFPKFATMIMRDIIRPLEKVAQVYGL